MQIDIGAYIAELLFDHQAVTIPGLGGFTTHYKQATIDQVQGVMKPPSKEIRFNKNLAVNDGTLVHHVMEKNQIGQFEAQKAVEDYVTQVLEALGRQEIVVFPKVGRLYRDYKGDYEFMVENTNFNTDAFGLPDIPIKPVIRSKEELQQTPVVAAVKNPEQKNPEQEFNKILAGWVQKNFPLLISVSVIIIALIIFLLIYDNKPRPESVYKVPEEQVNRKKGEIGLPGNADDTLDTAEQSFTEDDEEANATVEEPSLLPNQKVGIIMIGLFGDQNNITKLVKKLYDAGFEPYLEEKGKYTRVGVQFAYETQAEIDEKLKIIREKFEEKASVWRK